MARIGIKRHPKFLDLTAELGEHPNMVLGLLESMFHFAAEFTPRGDIGRFSNKAIARAVEWDGDPDRLIEALVQTGWLDEHPRYRLVLHDWHQHAPDFVRRKLNRDGTSFVQKEPDFAECATTVSQSVTQRTTLSGQCPNIDRTVTEHVSDDERTFDALPSLEEEKSTEEEKRREEGGTGGRNPADTAAASAADPFSATFYPEVVAVAEMMGVLPSRVPAMLHDAIRAACAKYGGDALRQAYERWVKAGYRAESFGWLDWVGQSPPQQKARQRASPERDGPTVPVIRVPDDWGYPPGVRDVRSGNGLEDVKAVLERLKAGGRTGGERDGQR